MPTASGKPTAAERRTAQHARMVAAVHEAEERLALSPEWIAAQVAEYGAATRHAYTKPDGTAVIKHSITYPAGDIIRVGREEVDEGKARSWAVIRAAREAGYNPHGMMSFGLFAGRQSVIYAVEEYR